MCRAFAATHKLDEWTIPDGTLQELPVLDMIIEDGGDLADFDPQKPYMKEASASMIRRLLLSQQEQRRGLW